MPTITYIDATGETPPLTYPEGYFALANPDEFAAMQNADFSMTNPTIPGIPTNPTFQNSTDLMSMPQVVPTPNNNAIKGAIPDSPFSFGANPIGKAPPIKRVRMPKMPKMPMIKNTSPNKLPNLEGDTIAENTDKKLIIRRTKLKILSKVSRLRNLNRTKSRWKILPMTF